MLGGLARVGISHLQTADAAGFVVAAACLLYSGPEWVLPMHWGWVGVGMMRTGKEGVAAPDSARIGSSADRKFSPTTLVVAALACAIASAVMGSMLVGPTAAVTEYGARLTASGLAGEAPRYR